MDYEKKYNYVRKRAKALKECCLSPRIKDWVDNVFPELNENEKLAENEDEKTRKAIIRLVEIDKGSMINNVTTDSMLSWLEKQGQVKSQHETCEENNDPLISAKFNVGDFVINEYGYIKKIINRNPFYGLYYYQVLNNHDTYKDTIFECSYSKIENTCHLWTVADAKNGDVLVASDGSVFIYASNDGGSCKHHIALAINGSIDINEGLCGHWELASSVKPATKEQSDLLFKKMKELGWEWDAKTKKLYKKNGKNWTEEDDTIICELIRRMESLDHYWNRPTDQKLIEWIKSLKQRMEE